MAEFKCERINRPITIVDLWELPDGIYTENCTLDEWLEAAQAEYMSVLYSVLLHRAQESLKHFRIV